jgi:hypothetical protein
LHHPTFSFRSLKTQLEWREYNGKDELYEVVDEIFDRSLHPSDPQEGADEHL